MSAFHDDMAAGYGFTEPAVRLGRPFVDPAAPDTAVEIAIPLRFLNRHGLIAGATGVHSEEAREAAEWLMRRCSGNPFFALEVLRALAESAPPIVDGEGWETVLAQASRQQFHTGGRYVSQQRGVKQLSRYQVFGVGAAGLAVPADMALAGRGHGGECLRHAGVAQAFAGACRNSLAGLPGPRLARHGPRA